MNFQARFDRASAVIAEYGMSRRCIFKLGSTPPRFLALELDEGGTILQIQQGETLKEIVPLLESRRIGSYETEILDLETDQVMHPTFRCYYQIPRIYLADTDIVMYDALTEGVIAEESRITYEFADNRQGQFRLKVFPADS